MSVQPADLRVLVQFYQRVLGIIAYPIKLILVPSSLMSGVYEHFPLPGTVDSGMCVGSDDQNKALQTISNR